MKIDMKKKEFQIWMILSILVTIVWISIVLVIFDNRNTNEKSFSDEKLKRFEGDVNSTLATYEVFSNYIFDEIEQDEEVKSIIYEANFASDEKKEILRKQLYDVLYNRYLKIKEYNYRQFQFHLPNTESFLRLHKPEKYGDILIDIRESVRIANENMINVSGFEEGRIFNGFRHVYPLTHNNLHIGSVEISVSTSSIIEVLSKHYTQEDFYFIIDKSAVEGKVFGSEMINYKNSSFFEDYYVDKEVDTYSSMYNKIVPSTSESFFEGLKEERKKSFSAIYKFNGKNYTANFLAIKNLKEIPVAYLISISESVGYEEFSNHMYLEIVLVSILTFSIILFGLVLTQYQSKLKNTSELDYLTKIYNRKKFYEIAKKEELYSKRYKYESSVMLIDIDHFKNINDTYGHEWGDQVLKKLASEILKNIRNVDVFARWGGEEFVLLLPHTKRSDAIIVAEKLRLLICNSKSKELKGVTISIGVSAIDSENFDIDTAIKLADEAMYCAKRNGRNQVYPKMNN